jgi:divalent metal cation (Fe/Co/Zn/Cd) transporter
MWYLVGKTAPQDFLNKLVYVAVTHDTRVLKIDTARAYHAGDKYYVEVDIVMAEEQPLKVTHDVAQGLQRKLEGSFLLVFHQFRGLAKKLKLTYSGI